MKHFLATCSVLVVAACWVAPAVKAIPGGDNRAVCERFANSRYHANDPDHFEKISLNADDLVEEKLEAKMGSQFISTVLSGNGLIQLKNSTPLPIQFTCLMESNQKTVFFHASPVKTATVTAPAPTPSATPDLAAACYEKAPTVGDAVPCLEKALKSEEQQLASAEKKAQSQASKVDSQWKNAKAKQLLGLSGTQWKRFRDTECLRRLAFSSGGNHPDIIQYECLLGKTQQRIQDLQYND